MEIRRLLIEQFAQSREKSRMIVADVDAAEAREQIEITPPLLVPEICPLGTHVNASVAEYAEQFHECRIDVAGVAVGSRVHPRPSSVLRTPSPDGRRTGRVLAKRRVRGSAI